MEPGVWIAIIFGGILILGGLFGPDKIKDFAVGTDGLHISRHQPTEPEREVAFKVSQDQLSPEIEKEGKEFIKKAEERPLEQRSPEDYLALATEKWRAKDYDAALADVYAGLYLNPENIRTKATLVHRKASVFYSLGLKGQAIKYYNEAIELDPSFSWPFTNLGTINYEQGKLKEAEAQYRKTIELDPKYATPHNNLGTLYYNQGKLEEAEDEYNVAIALNPNFADSHYNLGGLFEKQGKLDEAKSEYEEALRLKPDFTPAKDNLERLKRKMEKEK